MWRISLIVIVVCALAGALFWKLNDQRPKIVYPQIGGVVVARTVINKGEPFVDSKLESIDVDQSKIAQDAVTSVMPLLGRRAGYDVEKGRQICVSDILEADRYLWLPSDLDRLEERPARPGFRWVVYATRDIREGTQISPLELEMRELQLGKIPADALTFGLVAKGKSAKNGLVLGQIVSTTDLMP